MKRLSALLSSTIVASSLGLAPAASARECLIGEVGAFAADFVPIRWLPTDGRLMPIIGNEALYAVIGQRFGGDGKTTFALPTLPSLKPATGREITYAICVSGLVPPREQ